jgi:hypothetical protein
MIEVNLFYPTVLIIAIILTFVISRSYKDNLDNKKDIHFKDKDVEITSEAFKKIGEVKDGTQNEVILNLQNVENNKEIHSLNQKMEQLEQLVYYIDNQLTAEKERNRILKNRFDALTKAVGKDCQCH